MRSPPSIFALPDSFDAPTSPLELPRQTASSGSTNSFNRVTAPLPGAETTEQVLQVSRHQTEAVLSRNDTLCPSINSPSDQLARPCRPSLIERAASLPDRHKVSEKRPHPTDSADLDKERASNKRARNTAKGYHINLSDLQRAPTQAESKAAQPPSPLFFSHSPRVRPPLPPRFSSSEAGAAMMKKANLEDNTSVRTVRMARGSLNPASSPARASPSGVIGRPLDMPSASQSTTPEERESASAGVHALGQVGIIELLEQDDRVIFIMDLQNSRNFQPGPLRIIFANGPLKAYPSLQERIQGQISEDVLGLIGDSIPFVEFKSWVTSFVKNGEAMDVSLPTFVFAGVTWTCSTLRKRFRIISGIGSSVPSNLATKPPPQGLSSTASTSSKTWSVSPLTGMDDNDAKDYFGLVTTGATGHPKDKIFSQKIDSSQVPADTWREISRAQEKQLAKGPKLPSSDIPARQLTTPLGSRENEAILRAATAGSVDPFENNPKEQGFFDWTRLPITPSLPRHIQFTRSINWAETPLGPIENWSLALRSMCNLIMASPHPAAMYWGDELVAIYNEAYILLAGQKHPQLMGLPYSVAWQEIWENVKDSFATARATGQSTMKDDDCLFINRSGLGLEECYFSWSIIPLVGDDGSVVGLYNPAFEKTRRKVAERRMLTLREIGDKTAAAREVKSFWGQVLLGLEENEYDTPFVLLYSIADDTDSEESSIHSNSILSAKQCILEGTLPPLPEGHHAAPTLIDLKSGHDGFGPIFREAMTMDKPVLLETSNGTLDDSLIDGIEFRGFPEKPRAAVVCPIHPTTGDSIIGFLVMGINPRRPYDDDYNLFIQLLSRQLATSMASVVLFEEEIRRGQRAAKLAALDRIELSEQLAARTQEAVDSETKFTRMAEFAPVGMFIADRFGLMIFTNDTFHEISHHPKEKGNNNWMDSVADEDRDMLAKMWNDLIHKVKPLSAEFRFKAPWENRNGTKGPTWVLASAFPEKDAEGNLKSIFGSITNISQQKWAEGYQRQRMEEAVELKRQQSNFIDMTSHEMRNPLSAILQCADEISGSLAEFKAVSGSLRIPVSLLESNIDAAQTIALCANHQTRIVSDVLTLSKLDSALLLVTPVDIQPTTIVQQALKMFEGELSTADINIKFVRDESLSRLNIDWVRLDPSRLLQVLINLTTNAIKFTSAQKERTITVTLTAATEASSKLHALSVSYIPARSKRDDITEGKDWGSGEGVYLGFSVQDTGKGLTADEKKLLFQRFSQASPKTHVQYGGSGLGLFISRELVELQGGEIGVSSESGKGSTFAFYIKARRSSQPKGGRDAIHPRGASWKPSVNTRSAKQAIALQDAKDAKKSPVLISTDHQSLQHLKVLIVEDNLVNQKVLSKQLRNLGCTVHVANHGGECIEHLQKTEYWRGREKDGLECSVVLMDLEMPVMDGLTCTRKIRDLQQSGEIVRHVPIIAVSANARNAHINSALAAGMDDVVSKPFRVPELVPKIDQLVMKYLPLSTA